jgi:hypothetical protein
MLCDVDTTNKCNISEFTKDKLVLSCAKQKLKLNWASILILPLIIIENCVKLYRTTSR